MPKKPICRKCAEIIGEDWLFVDRLPVSPGRCTGCGEQKPCVRIDYVRYSRLKAKAQYESFVEKHYARQA